LNISSASRRILSTGSMEKEPSSWRAASIPADCVPSEVAQRRATVAPGIGLPVRASTSFPAILSGST